MTQSYTNLWFFLFHWTFVLCNKFITIPPKSNLPCESVQTAKNKEPDIYKNEKTCKFDYQTYCQTYF